MNTKLYDNYSVNKLIYMFSLPAIISLIIEMLTSVVDTSFAGHLAFEGENALSALGVLSPLLAAFVALQTLFSISTGIMVSKYLGRSDKTKIALYFKTGLMMTIVVSLATSVMVFLFMEPLLVWLGAKEEVLILAREYLTIILISNIFSALGYTLTGLIRSFGNPKAEAIIIILSVAINITCNALFTFGFQFGMAGIALGTLVSEVICAFIAVAYLVKKKLWLMTDKLSFVEFCTASCDLFKIGLAQTTIQLLAGFSAVIVNYQLLEMGGNIQIAIWSIANKIYMIMLMPIIGITQAIQTIIAYFDGKEDTQKKKMTIKKTILYTIIYGIVITFIVYFLGHNLGTIFTSDKMILKYVEDVIKVIFITFPFIGITYTIMTVLQITGREGKAVILGVVRQVIAVVPLVITLPAIFNTFDILNITPSFSIFFSVPLADLFTLGIAYAFLIKSKKEK